MFMATKVYLKAGHFPPLKLEHYWASVIRHHVIPKHASAHRFRLFLIPATYSIYLWSNQQIIAYWYYLLPNWGACMANKNNILNTKCSHIFKRRWRWWRNINHTRVSVKHIILIINVVIPNANYRKKAYREILWFFNTHCRK